MATDPFAAFKPLTEHHHREMMRGGVRNEDGSISTVRTLVVNLDGRETVIPTVWDGKIVDNDEAIERAIKSGIRWPTFDTPQEAMDVDRAWHQMLGLSRGY